MYRSVVASLVVVAILAGCTTVGPTTPASPAATPGPPDPTPSPAPTEVAQPLPTADSLEPGRYFLEFNGYRYLFTVADPGWSSSVEAAGVFQGPDSELAIFWPGGDIPTLYRRSCEWTGTEFDPGPSVDDLADALASLEDLETTEPADVTVSGYAGKRVALTVPKDVNFTTCDEGDFHRDPGRHYQAPGQTDEIYILDLDGERQTIVVSHTPGTSTDIAEQLEEMLVSLDVSPI